MGIPTARALRDADPTHIRQRFNVVVERIVKELRGVSCLALEEVAPAKQQIMASRSFSRAVTEKRELREALLTYVTRAAEKLRAQGSLAGAVQVFIRTNPFKEGVPQYANSTTIRLPFATDDTLTLGRFVVLGLKHLYRPGFAYQKAGVMFMGLSPRAQRQAGLFDDISSIDRRTNLSVALDEVNRRFGRGAVSLAGAGIERSWQMRRGNVTPAYTTNVEQLPSAS